MTLLPIVERELRIASRKWLTFWGRLIAAAFALLIFGAFALLGIAARGAFPVGPVIFATLKWMSFLFACLAGLFLTADSLSEEKREGTLGLLFLTDLRGYDVVFGKLISRSLQGFYGLLAAFPILALALLTGGVTGSEFGHGILIICDTLFLSLCLGLFVSSISRDVMRAINGTLLLGVIICGILPLADFCIAGWQPMKFKPVLSLGSPFYLFIGSERMRIATFWDSLGIQHALAWAFLIASSICAPRAWQEKSREGNSSRASFWQRWRFGSEGSRLRLRRRLLEREPLLWLAKRDRWLVWMVWSIMGVGLVVLVASAMYFQELAVFRIANQVQWLLSLGLLLWISSQACRFFVEGIRSGALELILVAPVGPERVVRSQWTALWHAFLFPVLLLITLQVIAHVATIWEMSQRMGGAASGMGFDYLGMQIATLVVGVVTAVGNLAAAAWFGMWMGVTTRKVSFAILKTLVFVIFLPWLFIVFAQILTMMTLAFSTMGRGGMSPMWIGVGVSGLLSVGKNIFFIMWARRRLLTRFRDAMLREARIAPYVPRVPPQAPPPIAPPGPPVISATAGA